MSVYLYYVFRCFETLCFVHSSKAIVLDTKMVIGKLGYMALNIYNCRKVYTKY